MYIWLTFRWHVADWHSLTSTTISWHVTDIRLTSGWHLLTSLGILLPSSLLVSLIQIITIKNVQFPSTHVLIQSIFGVLIGALLLLYFSVPLSVYGVTAVAMLLAGCLRLNLKLRQTMFYFLTRPSLNFYFINGIFHGFSNPKSTQVGNKMSAKRCNDPSHLCIFDSTFAIAENLETIKKHFFHKFSLKIVFRGQLWFSFDFDAKLIPFW